MIFPDVSVKDWCNKYNLKIFKTKCDQCGRKVLVNIPFIEKGWAGLIAKDCECGNCNPPATQVPLTKENKEMIGNLLKFFKEK